MEKVGYLLAELSNFPSQNVIVIGQFLDMLRKRDAAFQDCCNL